MKELKSDDELVLLKKTIEELKTKNKESEIKAEGLEEKCDGGQGYSLYFQ